MAKAGDKPSWWEKRKTSFEESNATCCKWLRGHSTVLLLSLALLSWAWALIAGVGALASSCRHYTTPADRQVLMPASGMVYFSACSKAYSWYWFLVVFEFAAVVWGAIAYCHPAAKDSALALLVIITTLLMNASKNFLDLHYEVTSPSTIAGTKEASETLHAANCALAGGILCCIWNILSCISLGWRKDCECSGADMVAAGATIKAGKGRMVDIKAVAQAAA